MKKIFFTISITSLVFFTACVNDADDFNDDHSLIYEVPAELSLANAQRELVDQMTTPSVNLNVFRFFQHYWATTTYASDARFNFAGTRKIPDNTWLALYADVLGNLNTAKKTVSLEVKPSTVTQADWDIQQANKIAILDILQVYTFQILVDSFGDAPYSEALDPANVLPSYDDDATIYPDLISRLDSDLAILNSAGSSFASGDFIFNGDVESWRMFANTLKVKIGINLADVNPGLAQETVESGFNGGIFNENVEFTYSTSSPNFNPIYSELVASNRNDFVPEEGIVDEMNALEDPRREKYFTIYTELDENGNIVFQGYKGGIVGIASPYLLHSHVGDDLKLADAPGLLFDAAEVNFYLAEAAARGYAVGGSVEEYYNTAIEASFNQWGVGGVDAYLSQPNVAYSTAPGDWKQKIGTQAWIAMYNRGFESWNFYRRLDYPVMTAPNAVPEADGKVPVRLTYPINEQTVNGANWEAASTAIGGDELTTKVFWDVN